MSSAPGLAWFTSCIHYFIVFMLTCQFNTSLLHGFIQCCLFIDVQLFLGFLFLCFFVFYAVLLHLHWRCVIHDAAGLDMRAPLRLNTSGFGSHCGLWGTQGTTTRPAILYKFVLLLPLTDHKLCKHILSVRCVSPYCAERGFIYTVNSYMRREVHGLVSHRNIGLAVTLNLLYFFTHISYIGSVVWHCLI